MTENHSQIIVLHQVIDNDQVREYSVVTDSGTGVASFDKQANKFSYSGDELGKFHHFVEDLLVRSVAIGKVLPEKIVHGFG